VSLFAVVREAGDGWADGGIDRQPNVAEHAAFMQALAHEGFVLFAGPLAGSERGRLRVLLIADGDDEAEIHRRLAADPWLQSRQLLTVSVEPWTVVAGADRIAAAAAAS
jgi:uncharacterized protein YciI